MKRLYLLTVALIWTVGLSAAERQVNPKYVIPMVDLKAARSGQEEVRSKWGSIEETVRSVLSPALWAALLHSTNHTPAHLHDQEPQEPPEPQAPPLLSDDHRVLLLNYWGFYLPDLNNVSYPCRLDLAAFYRGLSRGKGWAVKMVDSWGKLPDGMLAGNTWVLGLRDECVGVEVHQELPQAHFIGKYCVMSYRKKEGATEDEDKMAPKHTTPITKMAAVAGSLGLAIATNIYSTCMPSTCTQQELEWGVSENLNEDLELYKVACQTKDPPQLEYNDRDVTMIVVLCVLGALVLAGTFADVWILVRSAPHSRKGRLKYLLVFSAYTNLEKIFRININEGPEVISCLHGIRVLTMSWVVLGHAYLMGVSGSVNKALLPDMISEQLIPVQVILNGLPSVDTFFFISGLLVAYNLTKEFDRTRSFNPIIYVVHRFLRLAPPILLLCGIFAVFPPLFIKGSQAPLLVQPTNFVDLCRRYWWRDSFFLTNWFFNEIDTESCIPVCWYTSVDFQLYLCTPFFFLPLLYRRKLGLWWMYCLLLISCLVPGIIIAALELPPTQVQDISGPDYVQYTKWVYTKPWSRASPYLVGLCLGYILRVDQKRQEKITLKKWQVAVGWIVAIVVLSLVVFGIPQYNTLSGEPEPYQPAISITYGGLHRFAWGVGIAWIVFACHYGYGGPINTFLRHPFWQPLSRLTYTTFLIAFNLQILLYIYIPQIPFYFSHLNMITQTVGVIFLSALSGVVVSLLSESPIIGLERLILRGTKTDRTKAEKRRVKSLKEKRLKRLNV